MELIAFSSMILLMYFLAGINKAKNFASTVSGFKNVFFFKKLPNLFYNIAIFLVIALEILAPIMIQYSLLTNTYEIYAYYSSIGLAAFTVLATLIYHFPPYGGQYYPFMKNLTATGALFLLSMQFN